MITVNIVEDNAGCTENLKECLNRYSKENGTIFSIKTFESGLSFLDSYNSDADIVFMDIRLPDIDGMKVCRRLRRIDNDVIIIFVTDLAQYAIKGYEVNALDFIVKPLNYYSFNMKIRKAVEFLEKRETKYILIYSEGTTIRLDQSTIIYIEVMEHLLIYHTEQGIIKSIGSLTVVESSLDENVFVRCKSCYLVNLAFVSEIKGNYVIMKGGNDDKLPISRPKRKAFFEKFVNYYGGRI